MDGLGYLVGVLVVVVGIVVSIALHELGHMIPAKRFGVRVSRYMIGFGPTLWSTTRGETEYGIKALPLGGYVRLVGMIPGSDVVGARPRAGRIAELVEDARRASAEEILPGEEHRAFYRLSTGKKIVVMLGGPVMNLVIGVVLITVVMTGFGVATLTSTLGSVQACTTPTGDGGACTAADATSPAAAAGLQTGDRIVSYDGRTIGEWSDLQSAIRDGGTAQVPVVVERGGREVDLTVTPALVERAAEDGSTAQVPYVGIGPTLALVRQPITEVPGVVGDALWRTAAVVVTLPQRLVDVAQAAFGSGERDATSVVGPVGVGRLAGEIASTQAEGYGLRERTADLLGILASLNFALFVFNLIPLLPLDGGHVAGALWEGAQRAVARVRGLPRPRPADIARMMPLAYGMFLVLTAMGVLLIYADIVRPVTLG